ncbi:hypothetical protein HZH68_012713 [Vespula germanica]|uniref:Uncharacterized protein n=1 Tax=Vespula germanica TaxID=30212 RepID=A0A834JEL9_VESGE|nr:hypothetical protein HZH68_012713 [Vespula germanica]
MHLDPGASPTSVLSVRDLIASSSYERHSRVNALLLEILIVTNAHIGGNGGDGGGGGGLREQSALDACSKTTKAELIKRESVVVPPVTPTENSDRVGLIIASSSLPRPAGQ